MRIRLGSSLTIQLGLAISTNCAIRVTSQRGADSEGGSDSRELISCYIKRTVPVGMRVEIRSSSLVLSTTRRYQ